MKLKRCICSHNITLYLSPLIAHFGRYIERRENERIQNIESQRRVIERAKRILYDSCRVHPVCIICPKINSRTFESDDERKLHIAVELYEKFFGKDYEREMRAAVDCIVLSKYDPKAFAEMREMQISFDDKCLRLN